MARTVLALSDDDSEDNVASGGSGGVPAPAQRNGRQSASQSDLFQIDGRPARFHLYTTGLGALSKDQVTTLAKKIIDHGGEFEEEEEDADTIIVRFEGVDQLKQKYWHSRTLWVEDAGFIQLCINTGNYVQNLSKPLRKGMGGQPVGRSRTAFTVEDDRHLSEYLASVIPNEAEGGRAGQEIYKRLMNMGQQFASFQWALRHTMWSWRERYVRRKHIFDPIIIAMVKNRPPRPDGKGLYERSRCLNPRLLHDDSDSEGEDEGESEVGGNGNNAPQDEGVNAQSRRLSNNGNHRPQGMGSGARPVKRARHTEVTLRRRASPVEQARGQQRPTSFTYRAGRRRRSSSRDSTPFENSSESESEVEREYSTPFEVESDLDVPLNNSRPGPEDAGPSGTQRVSQGSPSFIRDESFLARSETVLRQAQHRARRHPPPISKGMAGPSRILASSQATLVGTAPTQPEQRPVPRHDYDALDGPTQVAREEEEESEGDGEQHVGPPQPHPRPLAARVNPPEERWPEEPARRRAVAREGTRAVAALPPANGRTKKRKRIAVVSRASASDIVPVSNSPLAHSSRNSKGPRIVTGLSRRRQPASDDEIDMQAARAGGFDDELQDHAPVESHTQEGDEDNAQVEDLLEVSHGPSHNSSMTSAESKHPFEVDDELDSDDARVYHSLLPNFSSHDGSMDVPPSSVNTSAAHRAFGMQLPLHDASLDSEDAVTARRMSGVRPPSAQRPSIPNMRSSDSRRISAGQTLPATPIAPGGLDRIDTLGSETDTVPMPGTRAKQVKQRKVEELKRTPYTPPSGTRAAQVVAATLDLRTRQVTKRPVSSRTAVGR